LELIVSAPLEAIAHSLRRERERAGLSLSELAKRAGVAKSTLSQLESASGNPSVETLWALSTALGVPFSRLVDPPKPRVQIIRAGEGPAVYSERAHYIATLLSSSPPNARRDIYHLSVEPGPPRMRRRRERRDHPEDWDVARRGQRQEAARAGRRGVGRIWIL